MSGAFLALWNSISSAALQPEYETWHTFEHVPERVGFPALLKREGTEVTDALKAHHRFTSPATGSTTSKR